MIWIIGEYAERIDNADELLESFLGSLHSPHDLSLDDMSACQRNLPSILHKPAVFIKLLPSSLFWFDVKCLTRKNCINCIVTFGKLMS